MSESEEMYLVTLARLNEAEGRDIIPVSHLAEELAVLPVSVNQMIHKLEDSGLVKYTQYKGMTLTETGVRQANTILRRRRLWEVFLVERLHFLPDEADSLACRLEHAVPAEAVERLAAYLGQPVVSPKGLPIPPSESRDVPDGAVPLATCLPGQELILVRMTADSTGRAFLAEEGIFPGECFRVLAAGSRGGFLIKNSSGDSISLSPELAKMIWVKGAPES